MVYIYQNEEGVIVYKRNEEPLEEHITLERMIPMPVKDGYTAKLNANFETKKVWYDLVKNPITLEEAIEKKIKEIEQYSNSLNVNKFIINESIIGWLTPIERSNYLLSLTSAELLGESSVTFFVNEFLFTVPILNARLMLAMIQRYADATYIVSMRKKIAVKALETVEEVEEFDIESDYPDVLQFNI